jgi:cytoskeletal protein RodZ
MSRSNYFSRSTPYKPKKRKNSLLVITFIIGILLILCAYLLNNVDENQLAEPNEFNSEADLLGSINDHPNYPNAISDSSSTSNIASNDKPLDSAIAIQTADETNNSQTNPISLVNSEKKSELNQ